MGNDVSLDSLACAILAALAHHRDPRIGEVARPLLKLGESAAAAVVANGTTEACAEVAEQLWSADPGLFPIAVRALLRLDADTAFQAMQRAFTEARTGRGAARSEERLDAVLAAIDGTDPRWRTWALDQLRLVAEPQPKDDGDLRQRLRFEILVPVVRLAAGLGLDQAVPHLLAILAASRHDGLLATTVEALGVLRDPRAIGPILKLHGRADWQLRWALRSTLLAISDRSAVEQVRTCLASLKDPDHHEHWHLRSLLDQLERRFPGA